MVTTVKVSGTLTDFGLGVLTPLNPVLIFTADQPATADNRLLSTRRVQVVPDTAGAWSVDLVPSARTIPETTYTLRIEWLVNGHTDARDGLDVLQKIVVPESDSVIGDLPSTPKDRIWVGDFPPSNPQPGLWWLDTSTYPYVWKEWV